MKLFFCDTKTTGLSANAAIIQFAGIYVDTDTGIEDEINIRIRPHDDAEISDKALEVNGISHEEMAGYMHHIAGYCEIRRFLSPRVNRFDRWDKMHFIAWNRHFDYIKMEEMFLRNGDKQFPSYFAEPPIDLKQIVNLDLLMSGKRPKNRVGYFDLEFALDHYGLPRPEGDLHDALVGIRITRLIWDHWFGKNSPFLGVRK